MSIQRVLIPVVGQAMEGLLHGPDHPAGPSPAVLMIHGWDGSQAEFIGAAERLGELGFVTLTFNLRGHNRDHPQFELVTREDSLRDTLAAFDLLAGAGVVDPERLGVVGVSYGGYLAMLLADQRDVRWLALRAPALYRDDHFDRPKQDLHQLQDLAAYRRQNLEIHDNRALIGLTKFSGDVLIVESENDTVVPHPQIMSCARAAAPGGRLSHAVIAEADHALSRPEWRRAFITILADWIRERSGFQPAPEV